MRPPSISPELRFLGCLLCVEVLPFTLLRSWSPLTTRPSCDIHRRAEPVTLGRFARALSDVRVYWHHCTISSFSVLASGGLCHGLMWDGCRAPINPFAAALNRPAECAAVAAARHLPHRRCHSDSPAVSATVRLLQIEVPPSGIEVRLTAVFAAGSIVACCRAEGLAAV